MLLNVTVLFLLFIVKNTAFEANMALKSVNKQ